MTVKLKPHICFKIDLSCSVMDDACCCPPLSVHVANTRTAARAVQTQHPDNELNPWFPTVDVITINTRV